ncbi:MAG: pyrroloquinoline quinone biosynthesis protein PqqC, partial [Nitrosopumilaceae archaeon]
MNSLIKRIDEMIEERSLLKHPFYQMWSDGKLSLDSLTGYSKEYFQLVKAVPSFMTPIIKQAPDSLRSELTSNQEEEVEHIK